MIYRVPYENLISRFNRPERKEIRRITKGINEFSERLQFKFINGYNVESVFYLT